MRTPLVLIALAAACLPAQAQSFSFQLNGRNVQIAIPKTCATDHCVTIQTDVPQAQGGSDQGAIIGDILSQLVTGRMKGPAPQRDTAAPAPQVQPADTGLRPPVPTEPAKTATPVAPVVTNAPTPPPPARVEPKAPTPEAPRPPLPPTVSDAQSPAGVWLTQNNEAMIHIVACGAAYCGYVVDSVSSKDGTQVILDMKPSGSLSWGGHVRDPKGGGTYDATMALTAQKTLAVRGCAFRGLICRGQTWSRI